jgi:hypothetical protein
MDVTSAAIAVDVLPMFEEEARKNLVTSTGGASPRPLADRRNPEEA